MLVSVGGSWYSNYYQPLVFASYLIYAYFCGRKFKNQRNMIADILKQNPNVQLVVSASDLRELMNEWCDEREALREADRRSVENDQRVTKGEAKKALNVTDATLWRWAKSGYLVPIKVGRRCIYLKSDIDRILNHL